MTPYINMDAQYLANLSRSFERDDPEVAARLATIAAHLQSFDDKSRSFDDGVAEGLRRAYSRSNVREESKPVDPTLAELLARTTVPVRKLAARRSQAPTPSSPQVEAVLDDLGIDLNQLLGDL